jgi:hypothetical protein
MVAKKRSNSKGGHAPPKWQLPIVLSTAVHRAVNMVAVAAVSG